MPRVTLRLKVLVPFVLMILGVIVASLYVVNQVVRKRVVLRVSAELQRSKQIFHALQKADSDLLLERSLVAAEAPYLKAAVDTGDSTTVRGVTERLFEMITSDILVVFDRNGEVMAQMGLPEHAALTWSGMQQAGEDSVDQPAILIAGSEVYRAFAVPITTSSVGVGVFTLGKVVSGRRLDLAYLASLKELVECELIYFGKDIFFSTLAEEDSYKQTLFSGLAQISTENVFELQLHDEAFLGVRAGPGNSYLLLKSVDQAVRPVMAPIQRTIALVGFLASLAGIAISSFMSYRMIRPIQNLVRATEEMSAGDYEHSLQIRTKDEIGQLTAKFEQMRQTIRQKIGQLNERNLELQDTLKKLEETQQELVRSERLAATGNITAQLSHELNNPIHNIRSCLEAAQKKIAEKEAGREFLDLAHEEILRISKLTRQMLDFYRPRTRERSRVQVNFVLTNVLTSVETSLQNEHLLICKQFSNNVPEILASQDQLKQVFLNLTMNAIDAMPKGGKLTVSTLASGDSISISFEDTGCGISDENIDKIFDAFFTTKSEANGVGLGLSVSYGIVKDHDGEIFVESEPGEGTTFVVKLPLPKSNRNPDSKTD